MLYVAVIEHDHHLVTGCPSNIGCAFFEACYGSAALIICLDLIIGLYGEDRGLVFVRAYRDVAVVKYEFTAMPVEPEPFPK